MPIVRVSVSGIADAMKELKILQKGLESGDIYKGILDEMKDLAEKYAPRFTGALEQSIRIVQRGFRYELIADVEHASFTEFGTKYFKVGTPERPMIKYSMAGKLSHYPYLRSAIFYALLYSNEHVNNWLKKKGII